LSPNESPQRSLFNLTLRTADRIAVRIEEMSIR